MQAAVRPRIRDPQDVFAVSDLLSSDDDRQSIRFCQSLSF